MRFRDYLEATEVGPGSSGEDVAAAASIASEALELVEQIAHRADSHLSALVRGGPQFIGWTVDRYIAAGTHDNILAIAAGLSGQTLSQSDFVNRPVREEVKAIEAATIADFDVDRFLAMISS
jgi:hypothetical protein